MGRLAGLSPFVLLMTALVLLHAPLSFSSSANRLLFQASIQSPSFGTPSIKLHLRPGFAVAKGQWNSSGPGNFTVNLYGGLSSYCRLDTTPLQTLVVAAPLLPPLPGGLSEENFNVTAFGGFTVYPSSNPNQTGTDAYLCLYVINSTGTTKNSTAALLNFSQIPPLTTTLSTTSTSTASTVSTFPTSSVTYSTTVYLPPIGTTSVTPRTTTTTVTAQTASAIYRPTTSVAESQSQSLSDIIDEAANSPDQPTLRGAAEDMLSLLRQIFGPPLNQETVISRSPE